jgi:hypothetical protein
MDRDPRSYNQVGCGLLQQSLILLKNKINSGLLMLKIPLKKFGCGSTVEVPAGKP